jgi:hypothetical protein
MYINTHIRVSPAHTRTHTHTPHTHNTHTQTHAIDMVTPVHTHTHTHLQQPFDMPKAPGDFGDVTKAATVKHVFSEMFKGNLLPAKVSGWVWEWVRG